MVIQFVSSDRIFAVSSFEDIASSVMLLHNNTAFNCNETFDILCLFTVYYNNKNQCMMNEIDAYMHSIISISHISIKLLCCNG